MHFLTFTLFPLKKAARTTKNGQKRCRKKKNDGEFEEKKSAWEMDWKKFYLLIEKQNAESCFDYFSEKSIFGDGGATSYGC